MLLSAEVYQIFLRGVMQRSQMSSPGFNFGPVIGDGKHIVIRGRDPRIHPSS